MNRTFKWIEDHGAGILTFFGAIGVVGTAIVASRDRARVEAALGKAHEEKMRNVYENDDAKETDDLVRKSRLTPREEFEIWVKTYIPTIGTGLATVLCIIGANALNKQKQAALTASCMTFQRMLEEYRDKVRIVAGKDGIDEIDKLVKEEVFDIADGKPPWDQTQAFFIDGQKQFFERTMQEVKEAEYEINRYFRLKGDAKLNDLYELLGLPKNEYGEENGWDELSGECIYGYQWIDFYHRYIVTDDGLTVCVIEMPFGPHELYEYDKELEKDQKEAEEAKGHSFHSTDQVS